MENSWGNGPSPLPYPVPPDAISCVMRKKQTRGRTMLPDRHNLDLDRIRDLLPVLVAGP